MIGTTQTADQIAAQAAAQTGPAPIATNRAAGPAAGDASVPVEDPLDAIRDEMLAEWEPVMSEALDPVLAAIDGASGYEDALARLAALPGMDSARLIDALVKGMFAARAIGDVHDG